MDFTRLKILGPKDVARLEKYRRAWANLSWIKSGQAWGLGLVKTAVLILLLAMFTSCVSRSGKTLVLRYEEFGPQVAAYGTIGFQWYQWNNHGDSHPGNIDKINVVVYEGLSLSEVMRRYPVIPSKQQDFRYLSFRQAENYCEKLRIEAEANGLQEEVAGPIKATQQKLKSYFGLQ